MKESEKEAPKIEKLVRGEVSMFRVLNFPPKNPKAYLTALIYSKKISFNTRKQQKRIPANKRFTPK